MSRMKELWLRFIRWHGWSDFVHWHGWSDFIHWKGWTALVQWPGWKKVLFPHPAIVVLLVIASVAGLCWVFLGGYEENPIAYAVYVVSFYGLVTVVAVLPQFIKKANAGLFMNPVANKILTDRELRFRTKLYSRQIIDFVYGMLKTLAGIFYASSWLLTDGLYNLVQGGIELLQILRRRKDQTMEQQWKSYRLCGWLTLVLHFFMTGPIFLMINRDRGNYYPDVVVIATAAFAFYKLINSFVGVAKDRKHKAPIDSSVRLINLTQAMFSLFSLQVSMFHTFGSDFSGQKLMNNLTGGAVCVLVVATGVYMIRRAGKALQNI